MGRHALGARLADDAPDRGRMMLSNSITNTSPALSLIGLPLSGVRMQRPSRKWQYSQSL
jgi:hypothetical protein